jgi:hypothetical protein
MSRTPAPPAPLDLDTATRVDQSLTRTLNELAELHADLSLGEAPDHPDIREVRRALDSARSLLEPARVPARRLWIAADTAHLIREAKK